MPSFRDLKGKELTEAATSREDVDLDDASEVSGAMGKPIVVPDNPHRDEIAVAREKAAASRANRPPRANPPIPAPQPLVSDGQPATVETPTAVHVLPPDFESGLTALEDNLRHSLSLCAALRARAQMDHDKLQKVEALVAALKG